MNPICSRISWKYQKNQHLIESLVFRNAPEFVYKSNPSELDGEIPVFTFHIALPDWFENQCIFISENRYKTLSSEEFLYLLKFPNKRVKKSILLTFDDGLKHVWTVAYPLLKKYNLKATCFLVPGCIPENDSRIRPNLENYWEGNASLEEILSLKRDGSPLATWEEIKIMHESGVIDFQSHTMYHSLVFTSEKIFDFCHPTYNKYFYGNLYVPMYYRSGKDVVSREALLGMPIYYAKPRMSANSRYFDDEEIRSLCFEFVNKEGGIHFFAQNNWRKILLGIISKYRKTKIVREKYETTNERNHNIYEELLTSRKVIEERLPGRKVIHLCYPWYEAKDFAVQASRKAGFKINYYGQIKGRSTNRPGDDPFKIVRIEEIFLLRLPGVGRKDIIDLFKMMFGFRKIPNLIEI